MFEDLRKKAIKSTIFGTIILVVIGLIMTVIGALRSYYIFAGYVDFTKLAPEKIRSQAVELDLNSNFGSYMYDTETNTKTHQTTTTDYYYIIWTGDDYATDYRYMTIKVPYSYRSRLDTMADNTFEGYSSDPIHFEGVIKKLDDKGYDIFTEYWTQDYWGNWWAQYLTSYYIYDDWTDEETASLKESWESYPTNTSWLSLANGKNDWAADVAACTTEDEFYDLADRIYDTILTDKGDVIEAWALQWMEENTLPYYIDCSSEKMDGVFFILLVVGAIFLIWGTIRLAKVLSGSSVKELRKNISAAGYTESQIESDFRNAFSFDKKETFKVGRLMSYYISGTNAKAIDNKKIMWAYMHTVEHRRNGIKVGTTYSIMVYDENSPSGRTYTVPNEAAAQGALQKMAAMLPWVVVGYSDELKKLYHKERSQFLQMRYHACEHVAVEPGLNNQNA